MASYCIVCNNQSHQLYAKENKSENVFCGEECQTIHYADIEPIKGPFKYLVDQPEFNQGIVTSMVQRMNSRDVASVMQKLLTTSAINN